MQPPLTLSKILKKLSRAKQLIHKSLMQTLVQRTGLAFSDKTETLVATDTLVTLIKGSLYIYIHTVEEKKEKILNFFSYPT